MANRWIKWGVAAIVVIAAAALFYEKVYIPKSTYKAIEAKRGDLTLTVFGIGNVGAKNIHPIASNTGGKLLKIFKDQKEWVKKGETIALLDPVDMPDQLAQAKAAYKKARYETVAAQKELEALRAQHRLARLTYKRYEKLHKKGYAAQAE